MENNKVQEILALVESEDNLPSNAGNLFRDILRYESCAWRELDIVRTLLERFLLLRNEDERDMVREALNL